LVTYTGGFCGAFMLIFMPVVLVYYARKLDKEHPKDDFNPNASPFKHICWLYFIFAWGLIVIASVIVKIASG
jgi:amino acid permease